MNQMVVGNRCVPICRWLDEYHIPIYYKHSINDDNLFRLIVDWLVTVTDVDIIAVETAAKRWTSDVN
ncbi:hypothetical protein DERF_005891 [Dermatophagoides farinae]|uniref:Uncharacterized protein n=1 Tax=Dermatophagoides farinae TaxID=6954 RepID=A0A922I6I1_DERFA|nr:hypothetical protein DERF_005891 [Dermatophagoides farinae]